MKTDDEMPTMQCPGCGLEEPDFDGFGMLAHTKPAYPDGCGWCRHAGRTNGVCDYCGDVRTAKVAESAARTRGE